MSERRRGNRGFTLVELLAVIAILVLLIAMLVPALTGVKELARLTVCKANFRSAGTGFNGFAAEHDMRLPNGASSSVETGGGSPDARPWGPVWANILNREYWKRNDPSYYPALGNDDTLWKDEPTCGPMLRFWTFWRTEFYKPEYLQKRYQTCAAYKPWGDARPLPGNEWTRPWIMNIYAAGGGYNGPTYNGDMLGKELDRPQDIHANYTRYRLGASLSIFARPSTTYILWDSEMCSDYYVGGNTGKVRLGDVPDSAPWTASGVNPGDRYVFGVWSFRHLLPRDQRLYQQSARSEALFADGHAEVLNPNDRINLDDRYNPR